MSSGCLQLVILICSLSRSCFSVISNLADSEINALIDIYKSNHGDSWTPVQWNTSHIQDGRICYLPQYTDIITCLNDTSFWSNNKYTVIKLTFDNNNISGTIPSSIAHLMNLQSLIIRDEPLLSGTIPDGLCQLKLLETLEYTSTKINGTIPQCIEQLTSLNTFLFDKNHKLSGSLPFESICNLQTLQTFTLERSPRLWPFSIPKCVSNLQQLTTFKLRDVALNGGLDNICNIINLEYLKLDKITLHASIPSCIGSLTKLQTLKIASFPLLYGSLPDTICNLSNLESLELYSNILTLNLNLDLEYENYTTEFASDIPLCIGDLKQLTTLKLQSTGFIGTVTDNICKCSNLSSVHIGGNSFSGTIPHCFGKNMSNLKVIHFEHNKLSGNIPESLCNAKHLNEIWFHNNYLEGTIPHCIFSEELRYLVSFSVGQNELYGTINEFPLNIINLSLYSNHFDGTFPSIPYNSKNLTTLFLHDNAFNGTLDDIFFSDNITLYSLKLLSLHSNKFYSHNIEKVLRKIFDESGDNIEMLTLYDNNEIHGHIPEYSSSNPKYLKHLHYFNIHGCDISGSIPQNVHFNELEFYTVHDNRLSCSIPENIVNLTAQTMYETMNKKTRQTLVVPGNQLLYYNMKQHKVLPDWIISPFKTYQATNLYIGLYDIVRSYIITIICFVCLFVLIGMVIMNKYYICKFHLKRRSTRMRSPSLWFEFRIPNIGFKFIDLRYLVFMIILGTIYKLSSNYYLCTASITSFDLAYYSLLDIPSNRDNYDVYTTCLDTFVCMLWIVSSCIICDIVCNLCIENHGTNNMDNVGNIGLHQHMFNLRTNPLFDNYDDADDDLDNVSLASSFLSCNFDDDYNTRMDMNRIVHKWSSYSKYGYFILWNILFVMALLLILLFGVSQALPDNNIFNIHSDAREILCDSIAFILAINSCITIPHLVDFWNIFIYNEYTSKHKRTLIILILRSFCALLIPMISSFFLLNNCGRYWIKFWNPCTDNEMMQELFTSTTSISIYDASSMTRFDLLSARSVCEPLLGSEFILAKCLRQYFRKWIIILIEKLCVCLVLPIPIIFAKWLKYEYKKRKDIRNALLYPRIDSEYFMVLTKLEMMMIWSLIAPFIVPITLIAIQSNRFFYGAVIKKLNWKLKNRAPAPVKFLLISICVHQILLILFANSNFKYRVYSYILTATFIIIDTIYIIKYNKRTKYKKKKSHHKAMLELAS